MGTSRFDTNFRRFISIFLDATFTTIPKPFKQFLILMVFDDETDLYIPGLFQLVLLAFFPFRYCYFGYKIKAITTDLGKGLISASVEQFKNTHIIRYLFHYKQVALRRKLIKLRIDIEEIAEKNGTMNAGSIEKKNKNKTSLKR
ncbi:LOW QUALITY PROTEIN: hypothetical protein HZS_1822 [Henneguya salminicola]|nr:LOW QUALITY PROTEIN: hypothetical protein HZS_1822 [Henneguya salminicola]